jgi:protein-tyrosine phosphatase
VFDGDLGINLNSSNHLIIPIDDNQNIDITKYFDSFIQFIILNKNKNILVHCQHGSSRSGSFIVFYLMYFHKMKYLEALEYAKSKRYGICPNDGFQNQIIKYFEN